MANAVARAVSASPHWRLAGVWGRDRVGAGRLAASVNTRVLVLPEARCADVVVIAVSDAAVGCVADSLAEWGPPEAQLALAVHCSGALTRAALGALERTGWSTACWHPLQPFPAVGASILSGTVCTVTAADADVGAVLDELTREVGGEPLPLVDGDRELYHAAATLACTGGVTAAALSGELFARCGLDRQIAVRLAQRALEELLDRGPEGAVTGPVVRDDAATIEVHREALTRFPKARGLYEAATAAARQLIGLTEDPAAVASASSDQTLGDEGNKPVQFKTMISGKIHRARVTAADMHYVGSITVDLDLLEAAGILPYERVQVVDIDNGARLETYTIPGARGAGEVQLNGAAARLVQPGDLVIVMAYAQVEVPVPSDWHPRVVLVNSADNSIERVITSVDDHEALVGATIRTGDGAPGLSGEPEVLAAEKEG